MTPTQRSLKFMRQKNYVAEVVERWNPHARVRQDLFNFIDVLCIRPGEIVGVQTTTVANQSARIAKIKASAFASIWIEAGGKIVVHGWSKKLVKRGGKAKRWTVTETEVTELTP